MGAVQQGKRACRGARMRGAGTVQPLLPGISRAQPQQPQRGTRRTVSAAWYAA
jgi:hypothetical protein